MLKYTQLKQTKSSAVYTIVTYRMLKYIEQFEH